MLQQIIKTDVKVIQRRQAVGDKQRELVIAEKGLIGRTGLIYHIAVAVLHHLILSYPNGFHVKQVVVTHRGGHMAA